MRLLDYAADIHSQSGEDGILAKILDTLPVKDKWCVEFGAWDGQHLSNTCQLIEERGYSAVLIEGDKKRCEDLKKRFGPNPNILGLNAFVGFTQADGLDVLLAQSKIPKDFDILSIDIDGNDYHVWNAVSYTPKVVCIEYNPTIPTEVDFVQPAERKVNQGASLLALTRLGKQKGYELIAVTHLNAIFVRAEYFPLFDIASNAPAVLREDVSAVSHIFTGYDGTVFITGHNQLKWHQISLHARFRQLPKIFRSYPGDFGPVKSALYEIYRKLLRRLQRA